jgi:hypothetical protein
MKPSVHHRVTKSLQLYYILSQINPNHNLQAVIFYIYFSIHLRRKTSFSKRPLSFRCPHQNRLTTPVLPHTPHMPHQSNPPRCHDLNNICREAEIMNFVTQFSPDCCNLLPLISKYVPQNHILEDSKRM